MCNSLHFIDENLLLRKRNERRSDRIACCINATIGIYYEKHRKKKLDLNSYGQLENKFALLHIKSNERKGLGYNSWQGRKMEKLQIRFTSDT